MAHFIGAFYAPLTASVSETSTILWQYGYVIVAGILPLFWIDLGKDEPGMTLQREYREAGLLVWRNFLKSGEMIKSPVDIDGLPSGEYRLLDRQKKVR